MNSPSHKRVNTPGSDENRLKLYDLMYKIVNVADMMEYPKPRTFTDEQAYSSGDEVGRDHIPTVNLRQSYGILSLEDRTGHSEPRLGLFHHRS
ncbi:hypothetical protein Tco_0032353 [Tanacetum coccineum]